jgi:hypothetical protein
MTDKIISNELKSNKIYNCTISSKLLCNNINCKNVLKNHLHHMINLNIGVIKIY